MKKLLWMMITMLMGLQSVHAMNVDEFIDKNTVLRMLDDHREGKADNYKPLWNILTFITWYRLYVGDIENTRRRVLAGEL